MNAAPLSIKATVITAGGKRVRLSIICPTRRDAEDLIEAAYPGHQAALIMVRRTAGGAR